MGVVGAESVAFVFLESLKVHDAAAEVLHRGLWKPKGDEETEMERAQKKCSMVMKQGR